MSCKNKLLIAHPNLPRHSIFYKSVIYVYEDNSRNGTVGVILNKDSEYTVQYLSESKGYFYGNPNHILKLGGPVSEKTILMLHSDEWYSSNTMQVGNGYAVSSDDLMIEKLSMGNEPARWRMYLGMSAWAPGQLEMEIKAQFPYQKENSWLTCNADETIMFEYDGETQWEKAVELSSQQMIDSYF